MTATLLEPLELSPSAATQHAVVAVVLHWRGRIALLRRSQAVGHDRGLWHCITGYLDQGTTPESQALKEIEEEAGLTLDDLAVFEPGGTLLLPDNAGNIWHVHTFKAISTTRRLILNDEHDAYRWTVPSKVSRFSNRVPWLDTLIGDKAP